MNPRLGAGTSGAIPSQSDNWRRRGHAVGETGQPRWDRCEADETQGRIRRGRGARECAAQLPNGRCPDRSAAILECLLDIAQQARLGAATVDELPYVDVVVRREAAGAAQVFRQRASVDEAQVSGGLIGAAVPQKPFFGRSEQTRQVAVAERRFVNSGVGERERLDLSNEPSFRGEDVGRLPYPLSAFQLGGGVGEPRGVRTLA